MCSNPLEISYSHIAKITLQDAPNVIWQGFSTSSCCQHQTLTSNIMDFRLFPSLPTSLMLFIPFLESVVSCYGWISPPIFIAVDVSSILGGCNEFSQTGFEKGPLTSKRGYRECVFAFAAHQPWRKSLAVQCCYTLLRKCFNPLTFHASLIRVTNRKADSAKWINHVYFCWSRELLQGSDEHVHRFFFFWAWILNLGRKQDYCLSCVHWIPLWELLRVEWGRVDTPWVQHEIITEEEKCLTLSIPVTFFKWYVVLDAGESLQVIIISRIVNKSSLQGQT